MTMTHTGLPQYWAIIIWGFMVVLSLWALWVPVAQTGIQYTKKRFNKNPEKENRVKKSYLQDFLSNVE